MKAQTPYRTVVSNLSQLSTDELDDVAAMIAGLLAARAAEESPIEESAAESAQPMGGTPSSGRRRGPGYFEKKEIHGHFYKYLRYWSGTSHKSTYKSRYISKWE